MKSTIFFRLLINALFILGGFCSAMACGPYHPLIPTPSFFALGGDRNRSYEKVDFDRYENLLLWRSQTSPDIPLADIEQVVYRDTLRKFEERINSDEYDTDNRFYTYLKAGGDSVAIALLKCAKEIEELWRNNRSPWVYPSDRFAQSQISEYSHVIDKCRSYNGERMRDRFDLQMARVLFAAREYDTCIAFVDSAFAAVSDRNLMKRMALRYAAGCWSRRGDVQRADSVFSVAGDVWSISGNDPVSYVADLNPDAPQLIEYIRFHALDSLFMCNAIPVAKRLLNGNRVKCRGDWYYIMAYANGRHRGNNVLAWRQIHNAMSQSFSSSYLRDLARAYKMKLDAEVDDRSTLLEDLQWIEQKTGTTNIDSEDWLRRIGNIIYADWIPRLWREGDYSTAILLCAYVDNLVADQYDEHRWKTEEDIMNEYCLQNDIPLADYNGEDFYWYDPFEEMCRGIMERDVSWRIFVIGSVYDVPEFDTVDTSLDEICHNEEFQNPVDYGNLSFQMMGSLTSAELAATYERITSDNNPLYVFLRRKACTDSDYYNEVIGTLALREENYARAIEYLSLVDERYLSAMNICDYFYRDPFMVYPSRWTSITHTDDPDYTWYYEISVSPLLSGESRPTAKLDFARRMLSYQDIMEHGSTVDERALARLMYAIGRRNSMEECWALTQYWRGSCPEQFIPILSYSDYECYSKTRYAFLYDYEKTVGHNNTEAHYNREIEAALAMFTSDVSRAEAHYILGNTATIIKYYANTPIGRYVKMSCDNWRHWL